MDNTNDGRDLCLMMGVCVWHGLSYLMNLSPSFRRQYRTKLIVTDLQNKTITRDRLSDEDAAACRLLLHTAPGWADWGNEPGYAEVLARLPSTARRISFPYPVFPALWPLHCGDERNDQPDPPVGPDGIVVNYPYGDAWILGAIRAGVPKAEIMERYRALDLPSLVDVDALLKRNHELSVMREQTTDIKISALVAERFRSDRLFQTMNHPTNKLLIVMASQALHLLGYPPLGPYPLHALSDILPIQMPIHPSIIRHFDLTYVDASTRYCIDDAHHPIRRYLTFDEYLDRYIDFV